MELPLFDREAYRHVLGHYPTGVCVITGYDDGPVGLTVGSFTSVSIDPPLVAFFPDNKSNSWPRIARTGRFCVNVLSDGQHDICRRFATSGDDKFTDIGHSLSADDMPVLDGVLAWLDCRLYATHEAGDHRIVLGLVKEMAAVGTGSPMIFFRGAFNALAASSHPRR